MIVIIGPSASGKTELALKIAKDIGTNIISADSRQIYKGLDYSTGKLPLSYKYNRNNGYWNIESVKYWGYDAYKPDHKVSAGEFVEFSNKIVKDAKTAPIICGGTGLYISALLGYTKLNSSPPNTRLRKKLSNLSPGDLLITLDNLGYKTQNLNNSEKNNKQRLIRKIEILKYNKNLSKSSKEKSYFKNKNYVYIGLKLEKADYDKKIESWVEGNFEKIGEETKALKTKYPQTHLLGGFIFKEMDMYLNKEVSKTECKELIFYSYRQYIKRQMTYFRKHFKNTFWYKSKEQAYKNYPSLF